MDYTGAAFSYDHLFLYDNSSDGSFNVVAIFNIEDKYEEIRRSYINTKTEDIVRWVIDVWSEYEGDEWVTEFLSRREGYKGNNSIYGKGSGTNWQNANRRENLGSGVNDAEGANDSVKLDCPVKNEVPFDQIKA